MAKKKKAAKRKKQVFPASHVYKKDCIVGLKTLQAKFDAPDLVFADPPYNLGKSYDTYQDKLTETDYLEWCNKWLYAIWETIARHGSFWLAISDEYACQLDTLARKIGFYRQNWVVWYYTFGIACQKSFSRSHTHLFHYTRSRKQFTFNADAVRVPSARQTEYNDKRAYGKGKLPDNTWILRPQELPESFEPIEDTWWFNRVCGTYSEREKHSPNQMPLALMERIILVSSRVGDLVCDPFGGTFTTGVAAVQNSRDFVGYDISQKCCEKGRRRIRKALKGAED